MNLSLLKRNITANFFGTFWSIFSIYFFLPFYLKFLGEEAYGLILFASSIQAVIFLFDAGFSSVLRRELAIETDSKSRMQRNFSLIRNIETFYGIIFISIGLIVVAFSPLFAKYWFILKSLSKNEISYAIVLMVFNAIFQMQSSLYNGALLSMNKQAKANFFQFIFSLFRNGLVIFVIMKFPTVLSFLIWQFLVVIIYILFQRKVLFSYFNVEDKKNSTYFDLKILKETWKVGGLFLSISILSTFNSQLDKIIISKLMTLNHLGYYNTSYTLGQILVAICGPFATAITPLLINSYFNQDKNKTSLFFHKFAKLATIISTVIGITLLMNSYRIISIWTNNTHFANETIPINYLMIVSGLLLASQVIPYALAVASADLKPIIYTCLINIGFTLPAYYWFGKTYGLIGFGWVWLISNAFMLFVNVYFYLRKSLQDEYLKWLFQDFLIPIVVAGGITFVLDKVRPVGISPIIEIIYLGLVVIISLLLTTFIFFKKEFNQSIIRVLNPNTIVKK
ncbi:MAG: oligosaccharide flippase family protein [Bacteroidota bacterium]